MTWLVGCGAAEFTTHDPYADAGTPAATDAGSGGGGGGGGGGSVGGGAGGGGGVTCSASNCQGCCANGACQSGISTAQCGRGGGACQACAASDLCRADQTCGLDPAATWRVMVSAAVVAPTNFGSAWDNLTDPDPELGLWCPATAASYSAVMPKVSDTFTPSWTTGGCTVTAAALLADGLGYDAIDVDTTTADEIAPFTVVPVSEADLRAGTLVVGPNQGLESMTVRFTPR